MSSASTSDFGVGNSSPSLGAWHPRIHQRVLHGWIKKLKHGTKMVSLDLEFTLQNPEQQRKHIQKSYKNHMNLCVLCISVNISYMTILLSHKEPLAWAETTFSPHRPGGRTGVSMTPAICRRKQESCRDAFHVKVWWKTWYHKCSECWLCILIHLGFVFCIDLYRMLT